MDSNFQAYTTTKNHGIIAGIPNLKLSSILSRTVSEQDQAQVDSTNAQTQQIRATTAQTYIDMGVIDPSEVRAKLASDGEFDIETMLDDLPDNELMEMPGAPEEQGNPNSATEQPPVQTSIGKDSTESTGSVGVLVVKDGKILVGHRSDNHLICGPGGHIEPGETPAQAAIRETQEEFGITPTNIKLLGQLEHLDKKYCEPYVYLCTAFEGNPKCASDEITNAEWCKIGNLPKALFPPFAESLKLLHSDSEDTQQSALKSEVDNGIIKKDADDDRKWITINGARIPIGEDGELQGAVGERIHGEAFSPASDSKIKEYAEQSDKVFELLTPEEVEGIDSYKDAYFAYINNHLNGKSEMNIEDLDGWVDGIDSAIEKFNVTDDLVAYRGTSSKHYNDLNAGDVFTEKGYYSTSLSESVAEEFKDETSARGGNPVMVEVRVPKGAKAIYLGHNGGDNFDENELLVARDTKYKVIDKSRDKIVLEVIP